LKALNLSESKESEEKEFSVENKVNVIKTPVVTMFFDCRHLVRRGPRKGTYYIPVKKSWIDQAKEAINTAREVANTDIKARIDVSRTVPKTQEVLFTSTYDGFLTILVKLDITDPKKDVKK
jgi:hypothetical protein